MNRNSPAALRPKRRTSFLTRMLVAAPAGAAVLGIRVGIARAGPGLDDRPLPRSVRLEYVRGPGAQGCPDAETIEHVISARVPHARFDPAAPARFIVTISRQGIKHKATVEVRDAEGASIWMRPFTPLKTCNMLVLDIGLMVGERFSLPPPAPAAPAEPTPPPQSPKPDLLSPPPERLAPQAVRWRLGGSAALALGTTPSRLSPALTVVDGGRDWRLSPDWGISGSLGARLIPSAGATPSSTREVSTTQFIGVLAPCAHRGVYFGCLVLELGALFASISNTKNGIETSFWAAAGPRLGVEWPVPSVPRLALRFFGDLPVTLHATTLVVRYRSGEERQEWKSPPVAGALSFGFVTFF